MLVPGKFLSLLKKRKSRKHGGFVIFVAVIITSLLNVQNGKERNFFRDFFFVDNKYIKYLALTISDLINTESKRKVLEHFGKKYSSVFKQLNGAHIPRWDEIFVFLLLEVGIYRLLTYLFRNTNLDYDSVKEAFRLRFGVVGGSQPLLGFFSHLLNQFLIFHTNLFFQG